MMSNFTPNPTPVELCPFCFRVMVELREFHAAQNITGLSGGVSSYDQSWAEPGDVFQALFLPFGIIGAYFKQRRLNRILREYPYSLYCAECGHVTKRRFEEQ